MSEQDLPFVVSDHRHSFPSGFFARLGPGFLREYYRAFLTGPQARCVVAEADGEHAGYLVGVADPVAHRDHVLHRHGRRLALKAAAAMIPHPCLALSFLRTRSGLYCRRLLRRRTGTPRGDGSSARTAVLTQVSVAPEARSQGIGSALIDWFDGEAAAAGCDQLMLVTASDDGAGRYYRKQGWEACDEGCTPDGRWLTTYRRPVGSGNRHDRGERTA